MFLLLETWALEFYIRFGRKWINFCQPKGTLLVFKGNTSFFVMIEGRRQEPHAFLYSFSAMKPPPCSSLLFPDWSCLGSFRLQEPTHVGAENPGHKFTTSISHHVDMWARMHNAASQYPIGIMCVTYGDFAFFKKKKSEFVYLLLP